MPPRPRRVKMKRWLLTVTCCLWAAALLLVRVAPVLAHESPDEGAEWLMADWMLLTFLVFAGVALITFLVATKRGYLSILFFFQF